MNTITELEFILKYNKLFFTYQDFDGTILQVQRQGDSLEGRLLVGSYLLIYTYCTYFFAVLTIMYRICNDSELHFKTLFN